MTRPPIVLIGLPGAGTSTVGRALGEALGREVLDTDVLVEELSGVERATAFIDLGEQTYRAFESEAAHQALATESSIVVLGSGALEGELGESTRARLEALRSDGAPVINLQVSLAAATPRTGLTGAQPVGLGTPRAMLAQLAKARQEILRSVADLSIDTSRRTAQEVTDHILQWLREGGNHDADTLS